MAFSESIAACDLEVGRCRCGRSKSFLYLGPRAFLWKFDKNYPSVIIKWAATWENRIFAYAKTKTQISFAVTAKLISAFVFATRLVQSIYLLNSKFQASSSILCLYSPVCVGPGRKPRRPVFWRRGSNIIRYAPYFFCRSAASLHKNYMEGSVSAKINAFYLKRQQETFQNRNHIMKSNQQQMN